MTNSSRDAIAMAAVILGIVGQAATSQVAQAHKEPDPLAHWSFSGRTIHDGVVEARISPNARLSGRSRVVSDEFGESLEFTGWAADCVVADDLSDARDVLPTKAMTISAWVPVDKRQPWGGIIGVVQDNGDAEAGWVMGYNE